MHHSFSLGDIQIGVLWECRSSVICAIMVQVGEWSFDSFQDFILREVQLIDKEISLTIRSTGAHLRGANPASGVYFWKMLSIKMEKKRKIVMTIGMAQYRHETITENDNL